MATSVVRKRATGPTIGQRMDRVEKTVETLVSAVNTQNENAQNVLKAVSVQTEKMEDFRNATVRAADEARIAEVTNLRNSIVTEIDKGLDTRFGNLETAIKTRKEPEVINPHGRNTLSMGTIIGLLLLGILVLVIMQRCSFQDFKGSLDNLNKTLVTHANNNPGPATQGADPSNDRVMNPGNGNISGKSENQTKPAPNAAVKYVNLEALNSNGTHFGFYNNVRVSDIHTDSDTIRFTWEGSTQQMSKKVLRSTEFTLGEQLEIVAIGGCTTINGNQYLSYNVPITRTFRDGDELVVVKLCADGTQVDELMHFRKGYALTGSQGFVPVGGK